MNEKTAVALSNSHLNALVEDGNDQREMLAGVLHENESTILNLLSGYYFQKRGKVHSLTIDQDHIQFKNKTSGSFTTTFHVNYNNGCQDLNYDIENERMTIQFKLDTTNKMLELFGEEVPERDPDEF